MKLTLPYPVSVNRYWLTAVNKKTGRAMMFPSKEGKAYKEEVRLKVLIAGVRKPIPGLIEFRARLVPANGVCMDLDNCLKVVIDALKDVAFGDDSKVFRIVAERAEPDPEGGARLEVEVLPLVMPMGIGGRMKTLKRVVFADGHVGYLTPKQYLERARRLKAKAQQSCRLPELYCQDPCCKSHK